MFTDRVKLNGDPDYESIHLMGRPPLPLGSWGTIKRTEVAAGRWRARAQFRDWDGVTRPVERFAATGPKAEAALRAALVDRQTPAGSVTITRETKLRVLGAAWLDGLDAEGGLADNTMTAYRRAVKRIEQGLGEVTVGEAKVGVIDRYLRAKKSAATAKQDRVVLTGMLNLAARHDAITHNPARETTRRTSTASKPRALTVGEIAEIRRRVAEYAGGNQHGPPRALDLPAIVDVFLGTGARIGEVLALRALPGELDLDADPPTATFTGKIIDGKRVSTTKGRLAEHRVVLPSFTAAAIRRQLARGLPTDENCLVFPSRTGGPQTVHNVERRFREARDRVGTDHADSLYAWVKPHTFRRTVATAIDRAEDIEAAARQLGHASSRVTEKHYVERTNAAPDLRHVLDGFAPIHGLPTVNERTGTESAD